ncbi:MAG: YggS family pyridoxal phosphate-dependent enzyme [Clostridiales Family XIII bacterium]|jgi:pyridoxal phosphate enzyme (YggS family)|nr:YggS family pyridoxal phosphate-dependent enzyme [Clostridiales Family XIII bacterium]
MGSIAENIMQVRERIARAAEKSGRTAEDIVLVAVSKTRAPAEIAEAIAAGARDFGENKAQEFESKYEAVKDPRVNWHFIGHLQRNKVKYLIGKVGLLHSVDSLRLAEEIDRRAGEAGIIMDVLVQVNAASEESKFGVSSADTRELVREVSQRCGNIRIAGLMNIAPAADDPEEVRDVFRSVKMLFDEIARDASGERIDMKWLSMGMTHDYEVAIEEGANIVRVGTGIFGERNYAAGA